MSIAYARAEPDAELLRTTHARRPEIDPRELIPVGADGLRSLLERYIDVGLSKFVVRPRHVSRLLDRRGRVARRRDPRPPDVATREAIASSPRSPRTGHASGALTRPEQLTIRGAKQTV